MSFLECFSIVHGVYCLFVLSASCHHVPQMCSVVYYSSSTTVYVKSDSYPMVDMKQDCFSNKQDRCYKVWHTIVCHLAYPKCVESKEPNKLHTSMPLCRSYCYTIKNITLTCHIPSSCQQCGNNISRIR